jgi:uncharacterized protein RhaS with RHS repeats
MYYYGARYYTPEVSIWLSVDPLADKYPSMSPYMYCAGNPVVLVDPDGMSISDFDEDGNYLETRKNNWFHNTFVGRKGRIVDSEGNVKTSFKFNDYKLDKEMFNSDGFKLDVDFEEKVDGLITEGANSINEEIEFCKEIGLKNPVKNGMKLAVKDGADFINSSDELANGDNRLFLIDGVAYNNYDAGNFLTGASVKKSNTYNQFIFRMGTHYDNHRNANISNATNPKYKPQKGLIRLDARADQKAIRNGFRYQRNK